MRIVIAPDSFKGCLDAQAVAEAIAQGLRQVWPDAHMLCCPMADGGEGTLNALHHAQPEQSQRHRTTVSNAVGQPIEVNWLSQTVSAQDQTPAQPMAVLEVAQVLGMHDHTALQCSLLHRHSQGMGQLLRHVLDAGYRHLIIGLGGSNINDGGAGMLAALGVRFLNQQATAFTPTPANLAQLCYIDVSQLDPRLATTQLMLLSDVTNPLCGPQGASAVYAPQKGALPEQIAWLDHTLLHYAHLLERALGIPFPLHTQAGAGAAGGLGFAFMALHQRSAQASAQAADFANTDRHPTQAPTHQHSGADYIARQLGLDQHLQQADWLITGEGRSDQQTLSGKAPYTVAQYARRYAVPVTLLSGSIDPTALSDLHTVFDDCVAVTPPHMPLAQAIKQASQLLSERAAQLAQAWSDKTSNPAGNQAPY